MSVFLFFISVATNAWFVRLLSQPLTLALLIVICFLLIKFPHKIATLFICLSVLTIAQLRINPPSPLLIEDNLSIHNRLEYMHAYPILPIAVPYWVEERPELRTIGAFVDRTGILFSPNYYFFANHPRERAGVTEFEKFPFVLLPFFILGLLRIVKDKKFLIFLPTAFAVIFGLPLLMYPVIAVGIYEGLKSTFTRINVSFWIFILLLSLSLIIQYVFSIY